MTPKHHTGGQIPVADAMNAEQKESFHNHYRMVTLPAGFELWRFVSKQADRRFGAFWVDPETMRTIMETLHYNHNFSAAYKKENIQNSLAVLSKWSELNWRLKVITRKEVIAYVGETGAQKLWETVENETTFGGPAQIQKVMETRRGRMVQHVIPRFRGLPDQNDWASIELFVHV